MLSIHFRLPIVYITLLSYGCPLFGNGQGCPSNIDFETGTFNGWNCYVGSSEAVNNTNAINLYPSAGPVYNRHTMFTANSGEVDPYGGFPVNCPNGSNHSIRLGNNSAGTEAEGISYEFTIPANQDIYSLIYHYAVVFQDPNHEEFQQPRLVIEITNVTDNKMIYCSSFTFIPYGSLLPGFFESPNPGGETPVWCKDWSAVSINLDGNAGKRIRLFFKTADCTFRRHFGYAYIDINSECSSEFVGATYCKDDTSVNLTAPYGYQNYTWYDTTFTSVLGRQQTISFSPPPPPGSRYAVTIVPYNGYGCNDTLYATLVDSLQLKAIAGPDQLSCNKQPVSIGNISKPGLVYSWSPSTGLSNPEIANPMAGPEATTSYTLTTSHDGGGCVTTDTVVVRASIIDSSLFLSGSAMYCSDSGDSSILSVRPTKSIQWFSDNMGMIEADKTSYHVTQTGSYYAVLQNEDGCIISTREQPILIDDPIPGINYPVQYAVIEKPLDLEARPIGINALWNPRSLLNSPESYRPIFTGSADQLYTIDLKSKAGCLTVDTQLVKTIEKVEIFVPTAFTPNGDGVNDLLRPALLGVKKFHYFKIFNQWGQQIFESNSVKQGWNGMFKGVAQSAQVVVWLVEGVGVDDKTYQKKGSTALLR